VKGVKGVKGLTSKKKDFEIKNKKIKKKIFCLKCFILKGKPFTPFTSPSHTNIQK
jgi:hypothetical protein